MNEYPESSDIQIIERRSRRQELDLHMIFVICSPN